MIDTSTDEERRADLEAMMAEMLFEVALAIRQGVVGAEANWTDMRKIVEAGQTFDVTLEARVRPAAS